MHLWKKAICLGYGFDLVASEWPIFWQKQTKSSLLWVYVPALTGRYLYITATEAPGQMAGLIKKFASWPGSSHFNPFYINPLECQQGSFKVDPVRLFPDLHIVLKPLPLKSETSLCLVGHWALSQDGPLWCLSVDGVAMPQALRDIVLGAVNGRAGARER